MTEPTPQDLAPSGNLNQDVAQISQSGSGIDALTKLATGNPHLVTNPGLLQALVDGNATYGQASAINAFMAGMKLQTTVEHARATGTQYQFTDDERSLLDNMGVHYQDISVTPQQLQAQAQAQAQAAGKVVATDQNGRTLFDANGMPVLVDKQQTQPSQGGGGFWHDVGKVFSTIGKGFNYVGGELGQAWQGLTRLGADAGIGTGGVLSGAANLGDIPNVTAGAGTVTESMANTASMQAAGYDPNNPLSIIAYKSSGKAYLDTQPLVDAWNEAHPEDQSGTDKVNLAQQFLEDPHKLTASIEQDPSLSAQQKADRLTQLNGQDFRNLVQQVSSYRAGIGNSVLQGVIDPVKHPEAFALASAGLDLAAGFAVDPVIMLGNAAKEAKVAQVGVQGFEGSAFANRINDILLSDAGKLQPFKANAQRGMQRFIDNVNQIRQVTEAGADTTAEGAQKLAAAYADVRATTPGLEPLIGDFTGANRLTVDEAGNVVRDAKGAPVMTKGAPITNMQEAADYLGSKVNFTRLMSGRAAVEWNYMPGALSGFGARALLKGRLAGLVGKGAALSVGNAEQALKVLPWANDAVNESDKVVAAAGDVQRAQEAFDAAKQAHEAAVTGGNTAAAVTAENGHDTAQRLMVAQQNLDTANTGLESARRAAQQEVMFGPQLTGEVRQNLLRRGTLDGKGFNPGNYLAANAEQMARRLSSFLPRNMNISLSDASSTDKVYKFLQLYTSRGEAALGAAKWAAADAGTRRTMIVGIQQQVMHAAGYGATDAGRAELARVSRLADGPISATASDSADLGHMYSPTGEDVVNDPRLGGQQVHLGIMPGHVEDEWTLPSFAQLSQNAARSAIMGRVFGPMFQSRVADLMTYGFKTIQLMKPSTWTRNMVEGLGNAAFRGELGSALRAKAAAVEAGVFPDRGVSKLLNPKNWGAVTKRAPDAALRFAPLALLGQAYRHTALRFAGLEDGIEYISRLSKNELEQYVHDFGTQHLRADLDPGGSLQARGILDAGLTPGELRFNEQHDLSPFRADRPSFERSGYAPETANGRVGAQRWAGQLALMSKFPEHANALMDAVKSGSDDVAGIVDHINNNQQLAARLDALRMRALYTDDKGMAFEARTEQERATALEQLARRQLGFAKGLVTGRDGSYLQNVDDFIRQNGHGPSSSWLMDNVPDEQRPFQVLAPQYIARPPEGGVQGFAKALAQITDKWYQRLVEDPIHHTTSAPVFLANYGKARYFLRDVEAQHAQQIADIRKAALDTSGMSAEEIALAHKGIELKAEATADALAKEQAVKMAWVRTEQIIDDPGLKTQLDVTGRNFFMYSRATQAMIRRWGQAIIQDPTRMEKAALALHAAEHSGMVYTDKNGDLSFIYPGSGAFINGALNIARRVPGLGNLVPQLPIVPDLTGKVIFAVPGLDNPLKMATSPIVNIPYRVVEAHMPAGARLNMDEWDKFINGPIGAGQIGSQFMPAALRNAFSDMSSNDRTSQWASAMQSALANLIAADPQGLKGIVPGAGASPAQVQQFLDRLKTQTQSILAVRAALGLFTPAPASLPTMESPASRADAAFYAQGFKDLSSEYTAMLDDFGGDYAKANQLWAALHPDKLVYETAHSRAVAKGAPLPADEPTFKWMTRNASFMEKYGPSAAYFLPPSQGAFSSQAYQDQLALGMRLRDTPDEFYQQVRVNQAGATYWPSYDAYSAKVKALKAAGDTAGVKSVQNAWAAWSADFMAANPLFKANLDSSTPTKDNAAAATLSNLRDMLSSGGGLPATVPVGDLAHMVNAYDSYEQWRVQNRNATKVVKDSVTQGYQAYMEGLAQKDTVLARLYTGVFRPLSPELVNITVNTGV